MTWSLAAPHRSVSSRKERRIFLFLKFPEGSRSQKPDLSLEAHVLTPHLGASKMKVESVQSLTLTLSDAFGGSRSVFMLVTGHWLAPFLSAHCEWGDGGPQPLNPAVTLSRTKSSCSDVPSTF
jgi:hypothetical protein